VFANGRLVASRKGGLVARIVNRPWPAPEEVVEAVRSAVEATRE